MVKEEKDYQFDNHSLISTFKNELKNNNWMLFSES
jgi:hypothetical protein